MLHWNDSSYRQLVMEGTWGMDEIVSWFLSHNQTTCTAPTSGFTLLQIHCTWHIPPLVQVPFSCWAVGRTGSLTSWCSSELVKVISGSKAVNICHRFVPFRKALCNPSSASIFLLGICSTAAAMKLGSDILFYLLSVLAVVTAFRPNGASEAGPRFGSSMRDSPLDRQFHESTNRFKARMERSHEFRAAPIPLQLQKRTPTPGKKSKAPNAVREFIAHQAVLIKPVGD